MENNPIQPNSAMQPVQDVAQQPAEMQQYEQSSQQQNVAQQQEELIEVTPDQLQNATSSAMISKPLTLFFIYVLLVAAVAGAFIIGIILLAKSNNDKPNVEEIKEEKKNAILSEIVKNNPQGIIQDPASTTPIAYQPSTVISNGNNATQPKPTFSKPADQVPIPVPVVNADGSVKQPEVILPNLAEYNYRYTKAEETAGDKYSECPAYTLHYDFWDGEKKIEPKVTEYYDFFDATHSYYKSVDKYKDGEVDNYYLGKYSNAENEWFNYNGGKVAAKSIYEVNKNYYNTPPASYAASYPSSYPVSYPTTSQIANNYFGSNAKIVDSYSDNGKTYYVIEAVHQGNCNNIYYSDPNLKQIVRRYWVEDGTFTIVKVSTYVDSAEENNLIVSRTTKTERKSVNLSEIQEIFSLKDVKNPQEVIVDFTKPSATAQQMADKILKDINDKQIYMPDIGSDSNFYLQYIYSNTGEPLIQNLNYRDRQDFYATTQRGQQEYSARLETIRKRPLMDLSYDSMSDGYVSMNIYDASKISKDEVIELYTQSQYTEEVNDIASIYIDDTIIEANRIIRKSYPSNPVSYGVASYPGSYPISYPASYPSYGYNPWYYESRYVIFEYREMVYVFSTYDYAENYPPQYNNRIESGRYLTFEPGGQGIEEFLLNYFIGIY